MDYIWGQQRTVVVPLLTCWVEKVDSSETRVSAKSHYLAKNGKINTSVYLRVYVSVCVYICACVCVSLEETWNLWGCWERRGRETHKSVNRCWNWMINFFFNLSFDLVSLCSCQLFFALNFISILFSLYSIYVFMLLMLQLQWSFCVAGIMFHNLHQTINSAHP